MSGRRLDAVFPTRLLSVSEAERIAYFEHLWLIHPFLHEAHARVRRLLRLNRPGYIIVLNGPTGVGKTRLC